MKTVFISRALHSEQQDDQVNTLIKKKKQGPNYGGGNMKCSATRYMYKDHILLSRKNKQYWYFKLSSLGLQYSKYGVRT